MPSSSDEEQREHAAEATPHATPPSRDFLALIPHEFARRHLVLSAGQIDDVDGLRVERLRTVAATPTSIIHNIGVRLGRRTVGTHTGPEELAHDIDEAYSHAGPSLASAAAADGARSPVAERVLQAAATDVERDLQDLLAAGERDLLATSGKGPVVRFVDGVLFEALGRRASDIHIQPLADRTLVRYRIDGVLHTAHTLPPAATLPVVSRVKVMGRMDIAERRVPQDGRATVTIGLARDTTAETRAIDLRLSTLPTSYGERAVVRLLDARHTRALASFDALGMPDDVRVRFLSCASRSSGIILVTGPTGSGKTTTLYTTLHHIARGVPEGPAASTPGPIGNSLNVMTIEDPIEYELATAGVAISQAQVNTKKGVTFARGLRHILRQDPDVIMVGEIRDEETARIAIQASLTGHLVLSTLHTNDASTAVTRLVDLGVEPYLVGASLACVLAQRLVRRLHAACGGAGCEGCFGTSFHGRIGLFELFVVDEPMRSLLAGSPPASAVRDLARQRGMRTLREAGLRLVEQGLTTRVEVERVAHMLDVEEPAHLADSSSGSAADDDDTQTGGHIPASAGARHGGRVP